MPVQRRRLGHLEVLQVYRPEDPLSELADELGMRLHRISDEQLG